eukprot:8958268-Pyramimonas_sp.AAC.3
MWTQLLGPSAELLWGRETCEWCAEMNVGDACDVQPLGPSAELLWCHEACEGCAEMSVGTYVVLNLWDLWRSSCHETCEGCAEISMWGACGLSHWDLRRSSYGATKRVRGVPK